MRKNVGNNFSESFLNLKESNQIKLKTDDNNPSVLEFVIKNIYIYNRKPQNFQLIAISKISVSYQITQFFEACYCLIGFFVPIFASLIDCSCIPVSKGTDSIVKKTTTTNRPKTKPKKEKKQQFLNQIVQPNCDPDKLCALAGANVSENQNERGSWT